MSAMRLYLPSDAGTDGYPFAWHETIKHQVRAEAGNRCVRCGHPYRKGGGEWTHCDEQCTHGAPYRVVIPGAGIITVDVDEGDGARTSAGWLDDGAVYARWRVLTVHHLDGNKLNCRWWNLVSLCQRCHLTIQGKVKMERRWLHEHAEWFKPYVAGYYAFMLLGEDLSRLEVEARLEELLALEERQMDLFPAA